MIIHKHHTNNVRLILLTMKHNNIELSQTSAYGPNVYGDCIRYFEQIEELINKFVPDKNYYYWVVI